LRREGMRPSQTASGATRPDFQLSSDSLIAT
jgi:hypothetical protein